MNKDEEPSVARILAHMMVDAMPSDSTSEAKTVRLNEIGFSNTTIAEILRTSPNAVAAALYKARQRAKTPAKKKK
jgi:DNA-directed RNA polymerase specialized sigma24 family protein